MELSTDNKTIVCLALAVALSSVPDRPYRPPAPSQADYSLDFTRHCVRERVGTGVGTSGKSAVSIYILFSQHGTRRDAEEFVNAVINESHVTHNIKYLQDCIENCLTKYCLDLSSARAFDTVCRQFTCVWSILGTNSGRNRGCVCRLFLSALIQSLQLVCTTVSHSFSILQHYVLYERLGTLSKILRTCVNQIYFTTADVQQDKNTSSDHEKYSGEWVIRAIAAMIDDTARFPLLTARLHGTARDLQIV